MFIRRDHIIKRYYRIAIKTIYSDGYVKEESIDFKTTKEAIKFALAVTKKIALAGAKDKKGELKEAKANRETREDLQGSRIFLDISGLNGV